MRFLLLISILATMAVLANSSRYIPHYMAKAPSPWLSLPPAESPLSPSPSSGSPAPSMDDDCTSVLYDMVDCIPYLSVGTNEQLDPSCCDGFKTVVAINIKCICEGLKNSAQLGIVLNMTRATLLPSACGVAVPPISNCHISLPPSVGPPDSSSPELPPSGGAPTSPTGEMVPAPGSSKGEAYPISMSFLVLMSLLLVSISVILV
ncbi:non-specific lipid transfer protein GPI-anchored 11-like isoform X2 [Hevea brasiliensis]|uniref:non-specific lipid transfer protein GPI-anchored 11-like isoform X2 n=1 Tax=Hevea brasiliensis TaxID=3981 RepID=UPI0025F12620|nr:non-specific lipid transfer protein GPI-anchored 11-like isoform X2 [Hevea brasiliensis]